MPTVSIYEICSDIRSGRYVPTIGRPAKVTLPESVAAGLKPTKPPTKTGLVQLTPEQAAGVFVEQVSANGLVEGYQRETFAVHAKKMAQALLDGDDLSEVTLAIDGGRVYAVDGQHRLVASVIARRSVWATIRPMTLARRAERFSNQNKARRVNVNVIVLASSNPIASYVKEAVGGNPDNPWSSLIGERSTDTKIGPGLANEIITTFCFGAMGRGSNRNPTAADFKKFNRKRADELHALIAVAGSKRSNPSAFRPPSIRAMAAAAVICVARAEDEKAAFGRWLRHMPSFDWIGYAYLTKEMDIRAALIRHWNKRLSPSSKVRED